jgi:hypothetical protein
MSSETRKHAHQLINLLPEPQLQGLVQFLETIVGRGIPNVPLEDEEISEEEEHAVAEARDWLKHHDPIPHEDVLAALGLTTADWERMGRSPLPEETNGH